MYSIEENEEYYDENVQYQQKSQQQHQFTFQNDSKDSFGFLGNSSQFNQMAQSTKFSSPTSLLSQEKEEKLEKIRQMETRMKQLQQEKMQIDSVINDNVERTEVIQENNKLKGLIHNLENLLRQKEDQQLSQYDQDDRQRQIAFEKKVNLLVQENTSLIEQFKSAQHDLEVLVKQKEQDKAHTQILEEKLLAVERINDKLEEKNRMLRDEIIQIQYHSGKDETNVQELKNQYKRVNDLLDLELKNKKVYEMQLISAKQSEQRLKQMEMEYNAFQQTFEKTKKNNQELTQEINTIKQQYYSENQKNVNLEKNQLKLYSLQKDLEVSLQHVKDTQVQLQNAEQQVHERDCQIKELFIQIQELQTKLDLKFVDEKQLKDQMKKDTEYKVELSSKLKDIELQKSERDQIIKELKREIEDQKEENQELKDKVSQELNKNKDLKLKELSLIKDIENLEEQLQNLQNENDKISEKYARSQKQAQKELEESQMIIDEIKAQNEGEFLQLSKKCQKLEAEREEQESEIKIVRSELDEYRKKFTSFKGKYEDERLRGNDLQVRLDDREDQLKQLKEQLEIQRQKEQKLSDQYSKIQEYTKNFTYEKENQLKEMQKVSDMKTKLAERQMQQKDNEINQIKEEMNYLSEQLDQGHELMKEYEKQCADIETLVQQKEQLQKQVIILERQIDEKNLDHLDNQQILRELEIEREKLSETILNQEQALKEAKQTENHIREEKRKLIEQVKSMNYEKRMNDNKALAAETVEKQNEELIAKVDSVRSESKQILEQSRHDKQHIDQLKEDLEKYVLRVKELEDSQSMVKAIQNEKDKEERKLEVEMLKMKNESLIQLNKEYEQEILQQSKDIQELEKSLKNSNRRINSLQQDIEKKEQEIADLKKEIENVDKQVTMKINHEKYQYQNQMTDLQIEVEQMRNLQEQIALLKSNDAKYIETIASLNQEINKLELDNQDLQFRVKQLELQLQKSQISQSQNVHYQTSQHMIDLETQVHELQAKNITLEQQYKSVIDKYESKTKLYEKYGVPFDPSHPNYNQTMRKTPQSQSQVNQTPYSPRRNQSQFIDNNQILQSPASQISSQNNLYNTITHSPQQYNKHLLTQASNASLLQEYNPSTLYQQPPSTQKNLLFPPNHSYNNTPTYGGNNYQRNQNNYSGTQINQNIPSYGRSNQQLYQDTNNAESIDMQILQRCQDLTKMY